MTQELGKPISYVTVTDRFYGHLIGKISKVVFPCYTYAEQKTVWEYVHTRKDWIRASVRYTTPYYSSRTHDTKWATPDWCPGAYPERAAKEDAERGKQS